jgi:hypothetical protein
LRRIETRRCGLHAAPVHSHHKIGAVPQQASDVPWWETRPIDVTVDLGTPDAELRAIEEVFHAAGLEAEAKAGYVRLSVSDLPPVTFVLAPVVTLATAFAAGVAQKAGADAWDAWRQEGWRGLRRFLIEITRVRPRDDRATVVIRDPTGPDVTLLEALPDEALIALGGLDWAAMKSGRLQWHADQAEWIYLAGGATQTEPAPRRPA